MGKKVIREAKSGKERDGAGFGYMSKVRDMLVHSDKSKTKDINLHGTQKRSKPGQTMEKPVLKMLCEARLDIYVVDRQVSKDIPN